MAQFFMNVQLKLKIQRRIMKWTAQEEDTLRELVKEFGQSRWEFIAKEINSKLKRSYKTGRQCREKYINFTRFKGKCQRSNEWTLEEEKVLIQLYKQDGPSWSSFVNNFSNKSQSSIKNKFYNNIRKVSRRTEDYQKKFLKSCRNYIGYDSIVTILEIFSQIQKWNAQNGYRCNQNSKIWETKEKILKLAFLNSNLSDEIELHNLIISIKEINKHLRCFGIFKSNNKKVWKLTESRIKSILKFDSILNEDDLSKSASQTIKVKIEEQQKQTNSRASDFQNIGCQELQSLQVQYYQNQFFSPSLPEYSNKQQRGQDYICQMLKQFHPNQELGIIFN